MKTKILLTGAFLVLFGFSYAQERQSDVKTSYKSIIPDDKQNLLRNIDMYANTQLAFRNDFTDGEFLGSKFKFDNSEWR